jgi:hypothetical protein
MSIEAARGHVVKLRSNLPSRQLAAAKEGLNNAKTDYSRAPGIKNTRTTSSPYRTPLFILRGAGKAWAIIL